MKTEIGYYKVNGQIYSNKFDAVMAAKETGAEVDWYFYDDVFSKLDWTKEPSQTIDELYRIRAQQIRDRYDYIIVFCSGGADSNNVIRTFLKNNIHVDEVVGLAPMSGLKNWNFDPKNVHESNTISETKFALLPLLNEIATANSKIKVTINDFFEEMTNYNDDDWLYRDCGTIVTTLTSHFTDVLKFPHVDKIIQQGKRVGLVYGTDKPVIKVTETGNLYIVFADYGVNYLNMPKERENPLVDRVLFYWTPDLPEIMVKQCHIVAKALTLPEFKEIRESRKTGGIPKEGLPTFSTTIANSDNVLMSKDVIWQQFLKGQLTQDSDGIKINNAYQRAIVPFIYPTTYTKDLFQCQKVDAWQGFFTKDQQWLHALHGSSRVSQMVLSGVKTLYNAIPEKYLNIKGTGFANNFKAYKFGNIDNFDRIYQKN